VSKKDIEEFVEAPGRDEKVKEVRFTLGLTQKEF